MRLNRNIVIINITLKLLDIYIYIDFFFFFFVISIVVMQLLDEYSNIIFLIVAGFFFFLTQLMSLVLGYF